MRRKNPHPKRAENARTVLKVPKGEREELREKEEEPLVLCLQIPPDDDDDDEMDEHIQREETDFRKGAKRKRTQQHECGICEKVFESPSSLAIHMRTHTNEKPYECDVCEMRFSRSENLKTHKRTHTNEKPYECHVCEKRYRQSSGLKYHMRTQH